MANSFMSALMGGIGAVGGAYAEEQKKQREYNLEQKRAEAEMERQENFARFQQTLNKETAKYQQGLQQENIQFQQGFEKSGYVDPATGRELTKTEYDKHPNPSSLRAVEDYQAEKKTDQALASSEKVSQAQIDKAKKLYESGQITKEEYEATVKKASGVVAFEKPESIKPARIQKDFIDDVNKNLADKELEGDKVEETFVIANMFSGVPVEYKEHLMKNPKIAEAVGFNRLASQVADGLKSGKSEGEIRRLLADKHKFSKEDINQLFKYLERKGELEKLGGFTSIWTTDTYKLKEEE